MEKEYNTLEYYNKNAELYYYIANKHWLVIYKKTMISF